MNNRKSNKDLHYLSNRSRCLVDEGRITELFRVVCLLMDPSVSVMFRSRGTNQSKAKQNQPYYTKKPRPFPVHSKLFGDSCESSTKKKPFSSSSSGKPWALKATLETFYVKLMEKSCTVRNNKHKWKKAFTKAGSKLTEAWLHLQTSRSLRSSGACK